MANGESARSDLDVAMPPASTCTGQVLSQALIASTHWLSQHEARINALNVFPVPDGDTGTNMLLTMQAAVAAIESETSLGAGVIAARVADGALKGARGNSGVILSQILAGFAAAIKGHDLLGVAELVQGYEMAAAWAYQAVTRRVEGTILTVARETAEAVRAAAGVGADLVTLMTIAADAAKASIIRTPELMPLLKEAGVVDSGGQGLGCIIEGATRYATGQSLDAPTDLPLARPLATAARETAHSLDEHGYCTNFMVRGERLDRTRLRDELGAFGTSMLVVGTPTLLKVHVHTERPGDALNLGAAQGELTGIEITNMRDQVAQLETTGANVPPPAARAEQDIAIVAVAPGAGLAAVLASFGVYTIPGGQTMNPSIGELLTAIEECKGRQVMLLPNNRNIALAARQAASLASRPVVVVPTTTVPAGIAASVAFSPSASLEENAKAMTEAAANVDAVELTSAARDTVHHGQTISQGDVIGLLNDELVAHGMSFVDVALAVLAKSTHAQPDIVTIYTGDDADATEAATVAERISEQYSGVQVDIVEGGQPHYRYMIGVE